MISVRDNVKKTTKYPINAIRSRFQTVVLDNKYQIFIEPNLDVYNAASDVGVERFVDEDLGLYVSDAVYGSLSQM